MTPAHLERIAALLYGRQWKIPMATALRVDPATVWRWATGRTPVPASTVAALQAELRTRRDEIERMIA